MEDVSHLEHNQCSAGCINPLLQDDIGDSEILEIVSTARGIHDSESVSAYEEIEPLVQAASSSADRFILIFWTSFTILSILLISLFSYGFFVPGTVILCCGIVLALVLAAKRFSGYTDWGQRRDLYSEL
jgi:hypothetical protein